MAIDYESADISADDELAFAELEQAFREALAQDSRQNEEGEPSSSAKIEYMSSVAAAIKVLQLPILQDWLEKGKRIGINNFDEFSADVFHEVQIIKIKHLRRHRGNSAELDHSTKDKIRHYAGKIKDIIDDLQVSLAKKDVLHARLNSFLAEVDRSRTRF